MKLPNKPPLTMKTIEDMEDMSFFTHALIFDNLLIVAQKETNCFVLSTCGGLVVIDAIWPAREAFDAIIDAVTDVGWNPFSINKLILTHGHVDHTGCGRYFVDKYKAETYMSKTDDEFWRDHPTKPDRPETWKDYNIKNYIDDGDVIISGETEINVVSTPGHTPGCLSYIFPVFDNGEKHMAALFGGTTPPWGNTDGTKVYLKSIDRFLEKAEELGADVALSNHTAFDNGLERITYSKKRLSYLPNIYIIGQDGFRKYCEVFKTMSREILK